METLSRRNFNNYRLIILTLLLVSCTKKINYPISIIYVDEKTEKVLGDFPIARKNYVEMVKALRAYSPKLVVLKLFFDSVKDGDEIFLELKDDHVYTQASALEDDSEAKFEIQNSIADNDIGLIDNKSIIYPNKKIESIMKGVGFVDAPANNEGKPYGFYLIRSYQNKIYPSLPLLIYSHIVNEKIEVTQKNVKVGKKEFKIDKNGEVNFEYFRNRKKFKYYSFIDVIENKINKDELKDNIVVIFYKGNKLTEPVAANGETYNPAEVVSDAIDFMFR